MIPSLPEFSEFQKVFARYQDLHQRMSGQKFVKFDDNDEISLTNVWESYKNEIYTKARSLLSLEDWGSYAFGDGNILEKTIEAIEIPGSNLLQWNNKYGPKAKDHRRFLDARDSKEQKEKIEKLLHSLYCGGTETEEELFTALAEFSGRKYPLLAYLFFLKDNTRFTPIQPTGFDRAFATLSIDLKTRGHCTWENYSTFIAVLRGLRPLISRAIGGQDVRLIDAHSFCWVLASLQKEEKEGRIGNNLKDIVANMIKNAVNAVNQSGKTYELKYKKKRLEMSHNRLEEVINDFIVKQGYRCKLTNIPFSFNKNDKMLHPSLDRIDSNGHYEEGNLQVVCQFMNFWKSDMKNHEVIQLLDLIRSAGKEDKSSGEASSSD